MSALELGFFQTIKLSQKWTVRRLLQILASIYLNRKVIAGSISLLHHAILLKKETATHCQRMSSPEVKCDCFLLNFTKEHQHANHFKRK